MSTTTSHRSSTRASSDDVRNAWLALLLLPLAFGGAFFVGEGLSSLLGYPAGGDTRPPVWVMLTATVPALVVFALPAVIASWFARRASAVDDRRGWVPAGILVALTILFIGMNVAAAFMS